ncbi:hypothetical protein [Leptospira kirschneri]|uniref:hypothetical protein n=1 Tax=Leptospira kirschneri TaxID=29507 RepID=UPI0009E4205C|nr:hypothetical protein [Leptospira kirschneri]
MKILVDVKDEKAEALLEILRGLSFVKTKPLTSPKGKFIEDIKEAVEEMKLVKAGKLKARPAQELLDEL